MLSHTSKGIGAGPLYTNAVMGQAPSAAERETARKASSSILRQDSIYIEESENISRPESWSMHFDRTDQAPYPTRVDDEIISQNRVLHLPPENPSHELASFLRTTGPTAPHRRPSKLQHPPQRPSEPKGTLRFLKSRYKRQNTLATAVPQWLDTEFRDEGGLLARKKYLALQVADDPSILHSEVSVSVFNEPHESEFTYDRHAVKKDKLSRRPPTPVAKPISVSQSDGQAAALTDHRCSFGPFRLATSSSATPEPPSAVSLSESNHSDQVQSDSKRSLDQGQGLASIAGRARTSASLPLPDVLLSYEQLSSECPLNTKHLEIKHPSPRRLASHPVLLQRTSSITSISTPRSVSNSPVPPTKSPLRLRREPRNIEKILASECDRRGTPKVVPSIKTANDHNAEAQPVRSTVITECTGPIKRPKSRGKNSRLSAAYPSSRKKREERIKSHKLRDRLRPLERIEAVVNAPPTAPHQRLKKARPQIQIPDLRPAPSATRASSAASSNASWKKVTEFSHASISTAPCEDIPSTSEKTDQTPISPITSDGSGTDRMALSSVMLVAEEVPLSSAKSTQSSSKVVMKESKNYVPRPRSASIPRNSTRKRSRPAARTPIRPSTPNGDVRVDSAPPLPSPPPTRALPAAPVVLESQKMSRDTQDDRCEKKDQVPVSALHERTVNARGLSRPEWVPHVVTQTRRKNIQPKDLNGNSDIDARLEALEKHNALLSAALTAVLKTNGALNSPLPADVESHRIPMAWEDRVARRSAAGQTGSTSNRSALELYMNTRHGSK